MSASPATAVLLASKLASSCSLVTSSLPPVSPLVRTGRQLERKRQLTLQLDVFSNLVGYLTIKTLVLRHLLANIEPGHLRAQKESAFGRRSEAPQAHLVKFVHRGRDGANLVLGNTANGEDSVQDLTMVDLSYR